MSPLSPMDSAMRARGDSATPESIKRAIEHLRAAESLLPAVKRAAEAARHAAWQKGKPPTHHGQAFVKHSCSDPGCLIRGQREW